MLPSTRQQPAVCQAGQKPASGHAAFFRRPVQWHTAEAAKPVSESRQGPHRFGQCLSGQCRICVCNMVSIAAWLGIMCPWLGRALHYSYMDRSSSLFTAGRIIPESLAESSLSFCPSCSDLAFNQLTGTLPANWPSTLPGLADL